MRKYNSYSFSASLIFCKFELFISTIRLLRRFNESFIHQRRKAERDARMTTIYKRKTQKIRLMNALNINDFTFENKKR